MGNPVLAQYRQREVYASDLRFIQELIDSDPSSTRCKLAARLCERWKWRDARGEWRIGGASDLLRYLDQQALIELPPPRQASAGKRVADLSDHPLPVYPAPMERADLSTLVVRVITREEWLGWSILIDRFHYLGCRPLVGENLRYAAYVEDEIVACLAWSSAALRCPVRDRFISWDDATRKRNLPGVASNQRFLILPWVRVRNLASKILAASVRRLSEDWEEAWGHGLFLAETFVDPSRFAGTCYRAAGWIELGRTGGRSRQGRQYRFHGQPKIAWIYPLHRRWKKRALVRRASDVSQPAHRSHSAARV